MDEVKAKQSVLEELEATPGTQINACFQCQKCASGCPVGFASDLLPSQIIQMLRLGYEQDVLSSRAIWLCVTCSTCTARCPMGIDLAHVMDVLRRRAVEEGTAPSDTPEAIFNEAFLKSVRRHGRVYEMGMMTGLKMRTRQWMRDVDKFPKMLAKGKIALLPNRSGDRKAVREVFQKAKGKGKK